MTNIKGFLGRVALIGAIGCGSTTSEGVEIERSPLTGLVAAYSFDQGSGSSAPDASGNGHTGTLSGATWTSSGKFCGALNFDGTNDRVTIGDASDLDFSSAFTLLAWVRPTALTGNYRTIILKERGSNALAYGLYANDGGNDAPTGYLKIGSNTNDTRVMGPSTIPTNTWTHLAASWGGGVFRLYRDGAQVATTNATGSISSTTNPLTIGGNGPWGEWFQGQIDEVRVYGRELSASEVIAERDTPVDGNCGGSGGMGGGGGAAGAPNAGAGGSSGASAGQAGGGAENAGAGGLAAGQAGSGGAPQAGSDPGGAGGSQAGGGQGGSTGGQAGTGQAGTGNVGGSPLTLNQTTEHQTIDGFGVSINSASWDNGELEPALDLLVAGGSTIFRVIVEPIDEQGATEAEPTNDNSDAFTPNWCAVTPNFSNPKFEELWQTIGYLNELGIRERVVLSFMGPAPSWMGGSSLSSGMLDEYAELVASASYFGRVKRGLSFGMLSPANEIDWDGIEGPQVSATNYALLLRKIAERLDAYGLGDVRLVGPETAAIAQGVGSYWSAMAAQPHVMRKLAALALHDYNGQNGNARSLLNGAAFPFLNFWLSELSHIEHAFGSLLGDASAVVVWDGYDSVYQHAILAGRGDNPGNDAGNAPAFLAYNENTGVYTPRDEYYLYAQLFKWAEPGTKRVSVSESVSGLEVVAFKHPTTKRLTVVGLNITTSSRTLGLTGASGYASLDHFRSTRGGAGLAELSDVTLSGGSATFSVPGESVFTLTGLPTGACAP